MTRFLFLILMLLSLLLVACGDDDEDSNASNDNDNTAPLIADAGDDFEIVVGENPTFDACRSSGNIENYSWTVLIAPPTMPEDEGKVIRAIERNCSFTLEDAMAIEEVGDWVIQLEVRNGEESQTDTVTVTVVEAGNAPIETSTQEPSE